MRWLWKNGTSAAWGRVPNEISHDVAPVQSLKKDFPSKALMFPAEACVFSLVDNLYFVHSSMFIWILSEWIVTLLSEITF